MRPITVGISCSNKSIITNFSYNQKATLVPQGYISLFQNYDVIPVLLSSHTPLQYVETLCDKIDMVFLTGGEDLDPKLYNEEPLVEYLEYMSSIGTKGKRPCFLGPDLSRDAFELSVYYAAKKRRIPIFGNCRGMQLMNVAEGGSLFQEIPESSIDHFVSADGWAQHHEVILDSTSLWGSLLDKAIYTTSSSHHQAIKQLAPPFIASGKASDGIIEMIEYVDPSLCILGIQGHIEKLVTNFFRYRGIIEYVIQKARENIS